jgi:hypothetical protein
MADSVFELADRLDSLRGLMNHVDDRTVVARAVHELRRLESERRELQARLDVQREVRADQRAQE